MRAQNVQVSWLSAVVFVVRSTAAWSRFCVCGPLKELKLVISCKLQSKADIFDCFFFLGTLCCPDQGCWWWWKYILGVTKCSLNCLLLYLRLLIYVCYRLSKKKKKKKMKRHLYLLGCDFISVSVTLILNKLQNVLGITVLITTVLSCQLLTV